MIVTTRIILVKFTSMFSWIYQYFGTFNQNFLYAISTRKFLCVEFIEIQPKLRVYITFIAAIPPKV